MNFRYTLILFLFSYSCLFSQSLLHTNGKAIVNASGDTVILKTMNLGGWMLIEPYQLQSAGFASAQWEFEEKVSWMKPFRIYRSSGWSTSRCLRFVGDRQDMRIYHLENIKATSKT